MFVPLASTLACSRASEPPQSLKRYGWFLASGEGTHLRSLFKGTEGLELRATVTGEWALLMMRARAEDEVVTQHHSDCEMSCRTVFSETGGCDILPSRF